MYVWVEPWNSIEDCGKRAAQSEPTPLSVARRPHHRKKVVSHRQVKLEVQSCLSSWFSLFLLFFTDDTRCASLDRRDERWRHPGPRVWVGAHRGILRLLETQRALEDGKHAGLKARGQVSDDDVDTWRIHGWTVESLRQLSGKILTMLREKEARRFCLTAMRQVGEGH
jgi:hypothetical protein